MTIDEKLAAVEQSDGATPTVRLLVGIIREQQHELACLREYIQSIAETVADPLCYGCSGEPVSVAFDEE